ncbi:PEPxxWA-CTERM sorting domain-containing protein [Sandaracinobacteroides saxicola]|uniref:PEPxxWA-CTERM sorting domain-containing protein n=1 Tax=Sandaracinobacteroides saxicola TaxID=2759707 RepID=UPI001FB19BA3|nr:PEPxxWA-CTERM sorting domain-containing protein [Sandaracinobacteroides saxicola]
MRKMVLGAALLAMAGAGQATVIVAGVTAQGAKTLQVSSAVPTWLEVAEVEAFTFADLNVALAANGGTASATSQYDLGTPAGKAIDGVRPATYPNEWHSGGSDAGQRLTISLSAASDLKLVSIWGGNRLGGFPWRDVYRLSVLDGSGASLWQGVLDASQLNGQPVSVQFLAPNPGGVVPEPASWAMMIAGFGLVGGLMRRRRTVAVAV